MSDNQLICEDNIIDPEKCSNVIKVTGENIITTIFITLETDKGLKTTKVIVKIDKIAPILEVEVDNTKYTNKLRPIFITSNDGLTGSGLDYVYENSDNDKNNNSSKLISEKDGTSILEKHNGIYYIFAVDKAGNISEIGTEVTVEKVDTVPPIIKLSAEVNWINIDREITVEYSDDVEALGYFYSKTPITENTDISNIELKTDNIDYIPLNDEYYYYVVDIAGNIAEAIFIEEHIDKVAPTAKMTSVLDKTKITISGNGTDNTNGSGIDRIIITNVTLNKELLNTGVSGTHSVISNSLNMSTSYRFEIEVTDKAGNISTTEAVYRTKSNTLDLPREPFCLSVYRGKDTYDSWVFFVSSYPDLGRYKSVVIDWYLAEYYNEHTAFAGDSYFSSKIYSTGEVIKMHISGYSNDRGIFIINHGGHNLQLQVTVTAYHSLVTVKYCVNSITYQN